MVEGKRSDSRRRPASRPGASGRGRSRPAREPGRAGPTRIPATKPESVKAGLTEPIRRVIAASLQQQNEQRLGFTARRAAILAALICVLTLTIAGPVRTYFAQRTEMKQLAASEASLRKQIADLESQKSKLGDPAYIAAQARERLGFVMPGDIPYQVQLPPGAVPVEDSGPRSEAARNTESWYTSLWHTIADTPHGPPPAPPSENVAPEPLSPSTPAPGPPPGG